MTADKLPRKQLVGQLIGIGDAPAEVVFNALERRNYNLHTDVAVSPYTVGESDELLLVDDDSVGGAVVINLPPAAGAANRRLTTKKLGNTGNVTLDGDGADTIDGAATLVITTQFASYELYCDGAAWWII